MNKANGRRLRKRRGASGVYKLESLFDGPEGTLEIAGSEHYIDGKLGSYLIVSVPETTSKASAVELERKLSEVAKRPVLVVTHNITFLRATMLSGKEREELHKKIQEAVSATSPEP